MVEKLQECKSALTSQYETIFMVFVFSSRHHSDQMSEGSQVCVSKPTGANYRYRAFWVADLTLTLEENYSWIGGIGGGGELQLVRRRKKQLWQTLIGQLCPNLPSSSSSSDPVSLCFIVTHLCDSIPKWRQFHKLWGHRDQNDFAILTTWRVSHPLYSSSTRFIDAALYISFQSKKQKPLNVFVWKVNFGISLKPILLSPSVGGILNSHVPKPYSGLKTSLALLRGGTTIKTPSGTLVTIYSFKFFTVCC